MTDQAQGLSARVLEDMTLEELERELVLRQGAPQDSPAADVRQELERELVRRATAVKGQAQQRDRDGVPELEAFAAMIERRRKRQEADDVPGGPYSLRTFELGTLGAAMTPAEKIAAGVLTTALEGGIGYWSQAGRIVRRPTHDQAGELDALIVAVVLWPEEEPDEFKPTRLELPDVARGLRLVAGGTIANTTHTETARGILRELKSAAREPETDYDADDADVIVQAAAFGELVYG